jgi:hypothetical protein
VASEPPDDHPGWRLKLAILAVLVLVSFGTIYALARANQGEAAAAIGVTAAGICTVLVSIWKR